MGTSRRIAPPLIHDDVQIARETTRIEHDNASQRVPNASRRQAETVPSRLAVCNHVMYFLDGKYMTEEPLWATWQGLDSTGAAARAAGPTGRPDASAVVVLSRYRHRVGTLLRRALHLSVLLFASRGEHLGDRGPRVGGVLPAAVGNDAGHRPEGGPASAPGAARRPLLLSPRTSNRDRDRGGELRRPRGRAPPDRSRPHRGRDRGGRPGRRGAGDRARGAAAGDPPASARRRGAA